MTIATAAASVLTHLREHGTLRPDDPPALRLQIAFLEEEVRVLRAGIPAVPPPSSIPLPADSAPVPVVPIRPKLPSEGLPFKVSSATEPYQCSVCHKTKPATEYQRQAAITHEHRRNGTVCKACVARRAKERAQGIQPPQKSAAELLALPPTHEPYPNTFRCQTCLGTAFAESPRQPGICVHCVGKMQTQGVVLNGSVATS